MFVMASERDAFPVTARRPPHKLAALLMAASTVLALVACDNNGPRVSAPETITQVAGASTPSTPERTSEATQEPTATAEPEAASELAEEFLASALNVSAEERPEGVQAHVLHLDQAEPNLWLAVSSGEGVPASLGERSQVAAVYERAENGDWVERAQQHLESAPTQTTVEILSGASTEGNLWAAVFGRLASGGSTFELLRYDGEALHSALWWYSPNEQAAQLIDLDDDGRPELVLDASDPSVLCSGCGVTEFQEVIYRWEAGALQAIEFAPAPPGSDVAATVTEGIAQVRAGLWRDAAATFDSARAAAPEDETVAWMARLAQRNAEGRLAHAGSEVQPLLTHVLAGEYGAAVDLMRPLEPQEAFSPEGPLVAETAAQGHEMRMGELVMDHANRALEYNAEMPEAYAVRALGRLLGDAGAVREAQDDLEQAATIAPDDLLYSSGAAWLASLATPTPEATEVTPEPTPESVPTETPSPALNSEPTPTETPEGTETGTPEAEE